MQGKDSNTEMYNERRILGKGEGGERRRKGGGGGGSEAAMQTECVKCLSIPLRARGRILVIPDFTRRRPAKNILKIGLTPSDTAHTRCQNWAWQGVIGAGSFSNFRECSA